MVLVGAPGAGKSTVGALLAGRLGVPFTDVDQLIETREQRPITEIFADAGEQAFRRLELDTTREVIAQPGVVALGGGAVVNSQVREALSGHPVVWLRVGLADAVARVGSGTTRPLLAGDVAGKWSALVGRREQLYRQVAGFVVDTDGLAPAEVAARVTALLAQEPREAR